jgi:tetratricopeptide (TPR) repeat protein
LFAYTTKSLYLTQSGRPDEGRRVADAELAVNSNYAPAYAYRGVAESALGQFEQAKSDALQAMRLSPRDPRMGLFHSNMAEAELGLGHFDAAIEESNKAIDAGYKAHWPYLQLATAHALKGDLDAAKTALAEARRLNPKLSIKWLTGRGTDWPPRFDALRKAGLPEE